MTTFTAFPDCCGAGILSGLWSNGHYAEIPKTAQKTLSFFLKKGDGRYPDSIGTNAVIDGQCRSCLIVILTASQKDQAKFLEKNKGVRVGSFINKRTSAKCYVWMLPTNGEAQIQRKDTNAD